MLPAGLCRPDGSTRLARDFDYSILFHRGGCLRPLFPLLTFIAIFLLASCGWERRRSDEELGLNPQQALGRRVFERQCAVCHDPYSSWGWQGPGLKKLFRKPALPSGTPANDERVVEVITWGKAKMPSFRGALTEQQLQELLAYLHTL